jgi:hypothetical protein
MAAFAGSLSLRGVANAVKQLFGITLENDLERLAVSSPWTPLFCKATGQMK